MEDGVGVEAFMRVLQEVLDRDGGAIVEELNGDVAKDVEIVATGLPGAGGRGRRSRA